MNPEEIGIAVEELQERIDYLENEATAAESQDHSTAFYDRRIAILKRAQTTLDAGLAVLEQDS